MSKTTLKRNPEVSVTEIDGEFFLVEPDSSDIFYLDKIAGGLWRFFDEPGGRDEAVETMVAAFPDAEAAQVRADAERVISELKDGNLLISAD